MFDSAGSAKRAAYGAGGVILDTFTIDDQRSSIEQMLAMKQLHPDMILITGGTDGGAVTGILRLTEILRIANPGPKYLGADLIPALYAGNTDATDLVKGMLRDTFALSILPNLRPTLTEENLKPTRDMIQKIFLENVMEKAPGYNKAKELSSGPILPTPVAVINSLELFANEHKDNILAFDIGGATTDVFSFIQGNPQRTVSANLGMSYSALNVLSDAGLDRLLQLLPTDFDSSELRNYLGNKSLYPTHSHKDDRSLMIEHALAKVAISQALDQHQQMHFNTSKMGFLDKLKAGERDKYLDKFEYVSQELSYTFSQADIGILIGIGGVFTAVQNKLQAAMILIDGAKPKGCTYVYRDTQFLSPHIGVLSSCYPIPTQTLLSNEIFEPLALHISPLFNPASFKGKEVMHVIVGDSIHRLIAGNFLIIGAESDSRPLRFVLSSRVRLPVKDNHIELKKNCFLILDARNPESYLVDEINLLYDLYSPTRIPSIEAFAIPQVESGSWNRQIVLPFQGLTLVAPNDMIGPEQPVAVNPHNPPRLYILHPFSNYPGITMVEIESSLLVHVGDIIEIDQVIMKATPSMDERNARHQYFSSPIYGKLEFIDHTSGILVLSEIQEYSTKPITINVAVPLGIKPSRMLNYLTKHKGDFVNKGETIARRLDRVVTSLNSHVKSPATGTIIKVDTHSGTVIIKYISKPVQYYSNVLGTVRSVRERESVDISFTADRINAMLGLGRECSGQLKIVNTDYDIEQNLIGRIVFCTYSPSKKTLELLGNVGISGMICQWIDQGLTSQFMGYELGIINTGNEKLNFSILILTGFATRNADTSLVSLMQRYESEHCLLETHTRIRAGVVRPACYFQQKKT